MHGRSAGWVLALGGALAACDAPGPAASEFEVADSAGVTVANSAAPLWREGEGWRSGPVLLEIGGDGLDLFDVVGAVRRPDGGLVVADGGTATLLFFDDEGALVRTAGGEGDGPGEFRALQGVGLVGPDTAWAYDFSHRRLSLYDRAGTLARTLTPTPSLNAATLVGWSGRGFVATQLWGDGSPDRAPGLTRERVVCVRYDAEGVMLDTVGAFPGREVQLRPEGPRMTMGVAPFARNASYALAEDGLVVGEQVGHEVRTYALDGRLRSIVRWAGGPLSLSHAQIDEWKREQVASAPSARRASVRAYLAEVPLPDRRPAYGSLLAGPGGELWVGSYAHPGHVPARWDAYRADGRWLGAVGLPGGFRPLQIGEDWVLGVARDALDVERVQLRTLVRSD